MKKVLIKGQVTLNINQEIEVSDKDFKILTETSGCYVSREDNEPFQLLESININECDIDTFDIDSVK